TLDALEAALGQRTPPPGLLHHSDRGSQYASGDYQALLDAHGLVGSMSRRGNCWDNAVAESFFSTLKIELVYPADWATRAAARAATADSSSRSASRLMAQRCGEDHTVRLRSAAWQIQRW